MKQETILVVVVTLVAGVIIGWMVANQGSTPAPAPVAAPQAVAPAAGGANLHADDGAVESGAFGGSGRAECGRQEGEHRGCFAAGADVHKLVRRSRTVSLSWKLMAKRVTRRASRSPVKGSKMSVAVGKCKVRSPAPSAFRQR